MKILYIAYSCMPNKGSEEKIGWNIPLESAKHNQVYVLTKEEHREGIEAYLQDHEIKNIQFFFVDIPVLYKELFRGIAYSRRLNIWHKRAFPVAKQICEQENIDLIHQITPVEFRSIGDYAKIPNVPFVCGPLGGGEFTPHAFWGYVGKYIPVEVVRMLLNHWCRYWYRVQKKLSRCSQIFFANRETMHFLSDLIPQVPYSVYSEIGLNSSEVSTAKTESDRQRDKFAILVAGRLVYRKGHRFLLDALSQLPSNIAYECRIVGDGPEKEKLKKISRKYGVEEHISFCGRIPFPDMAQEYENADVLVMPSIRETTGSVILEAMAKGLPVITLNQFGGAVLLDETTGWLYGGHTRRECIDNLRDVLIECAMKPDEIRKRGICAAQASKQHLWENKVAYYQERYAAIIKDHEG